MLTSRITEQDYKMSGHMFYRWIIGGVYAGLVVVLSACGVDSEDPPPVDGSTTIDSIIMYGDASSDPNPDDPVISLEIPMDNDDVADDVFFAEWNVSSTDPYQVKMYISSDTILDDTVDQLFFERECGTDSAYTCDSYGSVDCGFRYNPEYEFVDDPLNPGELIRTVPVDNHHYYLRCLNVSTEITDRVQADGFPNMPVDEYIIYRACNHDGNNCVNSVFQLIAIDSIP
jgi:hypothetical protein